MLIAGLPPDAAINRVEGQQWGVPEEMLAQILERIDQWGLIAAYQGGNKKFNQGLPDKPLRVPRPGEERQETGDRVVTDPREIARFFG